MATELPYRVVLLVAVAANLISAGFYWVVRNLYLKRIKQMDEILEERALLQNCPLLFATLTCDRCGLTVDARTLDPIGWTLGPPDYCPACGDACGNAADTL